MGVAEEVYGMHLVAGERIWGDIAWCAQGTWVLEQKVKEAELANRGSPSTIHAVHARD